MGHRISLGVNVTLTHIGSEMTLAISKVVVALLMVAAAVAFGFAAAFLW